MPDKSDNPFKLWQELKRRKVVRVITVYAAASFVILELVSIVAPSLGLPSWTLNMTIVFLCIGFIISTILSWVYDITPEGVQKTKPSNQSSNIKKQPASKGWKISTYISILVIAAFVVFYILGNIKQSTDISKLEKSIAVLPFDNESSDEENEYFVNGMMEDIRNNLSIIGDLHVLSKTSAEKYRNSNQSLKEIAEELDVNYLLEGTVQKQGNQIKVHAQLIEAAEDNHIWAQTYLRDISDIFKVQSEVAQTIAKELKAILSPGEIEQIEKPPTDNFEAYDLFLKGRYFWNKRTEDGFREALEYFTSAIEKDPNFALAYAGLADSYILISNYGFVSSIEDIKTNLVMANDAAIRAIEIDRNLAEAYNSLAFIKLYHDWDWSGASKDFERAILINPKYANAHQWYSIYLAVIKQHDKAIEEARRAIELDPFSPVMYKDLCRSLYLARNYNQVIEEAVESMTKFPDFYSIQEYLVLAYLQTGMFEEAIIVAQKAEKSFPGVVSPKELLGYTYGISGNRDKALLILDELLEESKVRYVSSFSYAIIHLGIGDHDSAIKWLEKAYEERSHLLIFLQVNPIFDPLRSDLKFNELVNKMGFEK